VDADSITPGRRYRLHPLRQSNLLSDRGETGHARTHFTGNDLTRIQAHPHL